MARPTKEDLGKAGEAKFREYCNNSRFAYLLIEQGRETLSSELWRLNQKRPDFLVTIPAVGSLLFDVKTKEKMEFYKGFEDIKRRQWGFAVDYPDFKKLERLQEETGLKVWYAFFEIDKDCNIEDKCYTVPLSNVKKFEYKPHREGNYGFLQIPFECLAIGEEKISLENMCNDCKKNTCDRTRKVLEKEK